MQLLRKLLGMNIPVPDFSHASDRYVTVAPSVSAATAQVLRKMLIIAPEVPSRNGKTRELSPHTVVIKDAGSPYTIMPHRGNNVIATVAETLWVWAGRNDVGSLSKWLPRASEYSDDWNANAKDGTWRAGYGPRLRRWSRRDGTIIDQLDVVVSRLQKSVETRQALFSIYDPDLDSIQSSKDYPCNLIVHLLVRDGVVNLHTYLRSNDVVFGYCINSFEWMFIWDYIADKLKMGRGSYHHTASSLHLYEPHFAKAERIVNTYRDAPVFPYSAAGLGDLSPADFTSACNDVYSRASTTIPKEGDVPQRLRDFATAIYSENALASHDVDGFVGLLSEISDLNLGLSLLELGQRRLSKPLWDHKALSLVFPAEHDYGSAASYLKYAWSTVEKK
jgi:thymidylate synthase